MAGLLGLSAGTLFAGRYEVRRILAKGGMGSIYVALDRETGSDIALKVLLPELVSDERMQQRFTRESRVAAEIPSPHVPRVFDSGIDEEGVPFIAMELLEGKDLRQHVDKNGPLTIGEAAPVLEQVGHALAAAHRMGLVHRDLKAENVFLHQVQGQTQVKLLDFGVVKILDAHRTSGTGTGAVGSPLWMAPEQTSAGGRIAPATDVWAYALLAYYLLTGKYYWKAATDETGVAGLLREMHIDPIAPPSERAAWHRRDVRFPDGFDAWFLRAMERDSTRRFRDGAEALEALAPALAASQRSDRAAMGFAQTLTFARTGEMMAAAARSPSAGFSTIPLGSGPPRGRGGASPAGGSPGAEPRTDTWIDHGEAHASGDGATLAEPSLLVPPGVLTPPPFEETAEVSMPPAKAPPASRWDPPPRAWSESADPRPSAPASVSAPPPSWAPAPMEPIPRTDPPPPFSSTGAPTKRPRLLLWALGLLVVGLAVSFLSGVIVWILLTVTDPSPARRPPERPRVGLILSPL